MQPVLQGQRSGPASTQHQPQVPVLCHSSIPTCSRSIADIAFGRGSGRPGFESHTVSSSPRLLVSSSPRLLVSSFHLLKRGDRLFRRRLSFSGPPLSATPPHAAPASRSRPPAPRPLQPHMPPTLCQTHCQPLPLAAVHSTAAPRRHHLPPVAPLTTATASLHHRHPSSRHPSPPSAIRPPSIILPHPSLMSSIITAVIITATRHDGHQHHHQHHHQLCSISLRAHSNHTPCTHPSF